MALYKRRRILEILKYYFVLVIKNEEQISIRSIYFQFCNFKYIKNISFKTRKLLIYLKSLFTVQINSLQCYNAFAGTASLAAVNLTTCTGSDVYCEVYYLQFICSFISLKLLYRIHINLVIIGIIVILHVRQIRLH